MPEHCDHYHEKIEEILQEIASNNKEHESFRRRLNEMEKQSDKQTDLIVELKEQGNTLKTMTKSLNNMEKTITDVSERVGKLEREPADKWKKITYEIIKYIVLAAVGVAVGYVIKGA